MTKNEEFWHQLVSCAWNGSERYRMLNSMSGIFGLTRLFEFEAKIFSQQTKQTRKRKNSILIPRPLQHTKGRCTDTDLDRMHRFPDAILPYLKSNLLIKANYKQGRVSVPPKVCVSLRWRKIGNTDKMSHAAVPVQPAEYVPGRSLSGTPQTEVRLDLEICHNFVIFVARRLLFLPYHRLKTLCCVRSNRFCASVTKFSRYLLSRRKNILEVPLSKSQMLEMLGNWQFDLSWGVRHTTTQMPATP